MFPEVRQEDMMREYICSRKDDQGTMTNYHVIVGGLGSSEVIQSLKADDDSRFDKYRNMSFAGQLHIMRQNGQQHYVKRDSAEFTSIADRVLLNVGEGDVREVSPCKSHEVAMQYAQR